MLSEGGSFTACRSVWHVNLCPCIARLFPYLRDFASKLEAIVVVGFTMRDIAGERIGSWCAECKMCRLHELVYGFLGVDATIARLCPVAEKLGFQGGYKIGRASCRERM